MNDFSYKMMQTCIITTFTDYACIYILTKHICLIPNYVGFWHKTKYLFEVIHFPIFVYQCWFVIFIKDIVHSSGQYWNMLDRKKKFNSYSIYQYHGIRSLTNTGRRGYGNMQCVCAGWRGDIMMKSDKGTFNAGMQFWIYLITLMFRLWEWFSCPRRVIIHGR